VAATWSDRPSSLLWRSSLLAALIANITIAQAYCRRCATDILPSPRVPVADRCREEFDEAPGGSLTGAPDRGWQPFKSSPREIPRGIGTSSALIVAAHGNLDGGNQTPLGQRSPQGQFRCQSKHSSQDALPSNQFQTKKFGLFFLPRLMPHNVLYDTSPEMVVKNRASRSGKNRQGRAEAAEGVPPKEMIVS